MTRVIIYIRVSDDKQVESGLGLQAQRDKCEGYAKLYDLAVVEVIEDGVTGKHLNRPGLQRALSMLRDGRADALLIMKLDRLVRSVRGLGELLDEYFSDGRAALLSVQDQIDTRTASGRLVLNVLASVAQWERESIVERTVAALVVKKERGERTGNVPIGKRLARDGKRLLPHGGEQAAIARTRQLRQDGKSFSEIGRVLVDEGMRPRTGIAWHSETLRRMVVG